MAMSAQRRPRVYAVRGGQHHHGAIHAPVPGPAAAASGGRRAAAASGARAERDLQLSGVHARGGARCVVAPFSARPRDNDALGGGARRCAATVSETPSADGVWPSAEAASRDVRGDRSLALHELAAGDRLVGTRGVGGGAVTPRAWDAALHKARSSATTLPL